MTDGPPLFAGEPEHCSLCGEPGHTHDDHWLFQHEPVQALQAKVRDLEAQLKEYDRTITKETMAVLDETKPIPDADLDEILESAGLAFWLAPFARAVQAMRKGQP